MPSSTPVNLNDRELWINELREISDRCVARPILDRRSDAELVGYDESGIPG
jgi:hypothetical protein